MKFFGIIFLFVLALVATNLMNLVRIDFNTEPTVIERKIKIPTESIQDLSTQAQFILPDRPALVVVFGTWCKPCRYEMPVLAQIANRKDLPLIGIALRDTPQKIDRYFKKIPNPFNQIALDDNSDWARALKAYTVPAVYIYNGKGTFIYEVGGMLDLDFYIQKLLPIIQELNNENHS